MSTLTVTTRSIAKATQNAKKLDAEPLNDHPADSDTYCVICLSDIDGKPVHLKCGHVFCGQCITDHLISDRTTRCPTCRTGLDPDEDEYVSSYDEDDGIVGINFYDAIKIGRKAKKTCKNTKKMFDTAKRWKNAKSEASKALKELRKVIGPLEDEMDAKIVAYTEAIEAQFATKNKQTLENIDRIVKDLHKASIGHQGAKLRIAVKHGYVKPRSRRYSSTRR